FITSPGLRANGRTRKELGMPGAGPTTVITDKAILEADPESGELVLASLYPGITAEEVAQGVGWTLRSRSRLTEAPTPSGRELHLLREVLDPKRLYLKQ
ncbi:MAG TPA: hypothetical protein VGP44_00760, partial [Gemmatimonadales bacterium]|nr:hypothetical protein [Gemmatimonadales bacterium]